MPALKALLIVPILLLGIFGCATPELPPAIKPAQVGPARLSPPPEDVMVPRPAPSVSVQPVPWLLNEERRR